jgi:hypothetical protein
VSHTHKHTHSHTQMHARTHARTNPHTHTNAPTHARTRTRTRTRTYTQEGPGKKQGQTLNHKQGSATVNPAHSDGQSCTQRRSILHTATVNPAHSDGESSRKIICTAPLARRLQSLLTTQRARKRSHSHKLGTASTYTRTHARTRTRTLAHPSTHPPTHPHARTHAHTHLPSISSRALLAPPPPAPPGRVRNRPSSWRIYIYIYIYIYAYICIYNMQVGPGLGHLHGGHLRLPIFTMYILFICILHI